MDKALLKQARRLNLRNGGPNCPIPPIVLMTDDQRLPDPEPVIRALPRDSMVIFRHYDHPMRAKLGAKLRTICRSKGIPFLVANDVALALRLDADGVHFPEYRVLSNPSVLTCLPSHLVRTSACHSFRVLHKLRDFPHGMRPDAFLISPVFATDSHPDRSYLGMTQALHMGQACSAMRIKAIALGGINSVNVEQLYCSSFVSLAGISFAWNLDRFVLK
ncbi:thiamine phosphate synthase [Thalassospira tepidiphila]|uniref:thiamine phosphate synthase n=1 Tax=Thalassospira tepidiphila TaxID=393657 RepID=UPI003AA8F645